ncbi:MAG: OadG family protein [Clostridia bacterium]|nr:OadG family protein [Clostridia bacterium]
MSKNKKQKKENVVYYDDNSTIADMTYVTRDGKPKPKKPVQPVPQTSKWQTYWSAVKMMFIPMCVVLLVLGVIYLLLRLISGNLF